jgi:hypothetical protein
VTEIAGSIHINSTQLCFLFFYFHLFFVHPIIFQYFIFNILYFKKCSIHEQYTFHQKDVSYNRSCVKPSGDFLNWISVDIL